MLIDDFEISYVEVSIYIVVIHRVSQQKNVFREKNLQMLSTFNKFFLGILEANFCIFFIYTLYINKIAMLHCVSYKIKFLKKKKLERSSTADISKVFNNFCLLRQF